MKVRITICLLGFLIGFGAGALADYRSGFYLNDSSLFQVNSVWHKVSWICLVATSVLLLSSKHAFKKMLISCLATTLLGFLNYLVASSTLRNQFFGMGLDARFALSVDESSRLAEYIANLPIHNDEEFIDWQAFTRISHNHLPPIERIVARKGIVFFRLDGFHDKLKIAVCLKTENKEKVKNALTKGRWKIADFSSEHIQYINICKLTLCWEDVTLTK